MNFPLVLFAAALLLVEAPEPLLPCTPPMDMLMARCMPVRVGEKGGGGIGGGEGGKGGERGGGARGGRGG